MARKSLLVAVFVVLAMPATASDIADAVRRGDKEAVRRLVAAKVDVNAPQGDGTTALQWAAYNDDVEAADEVTGLRFPQCETGRRAHDVSNAIAKPLSLGMDAAEMRVHDVERRHRQPSLLAGLRRFLRPR